MDHTALSTLAAQVGLAELIRSPEAWIALATLTALEIVLGIDNIVFIAVLTDRLPEEKRPLAYRLGLGGAMVTRVGLLLSLIRLWRCRR